YLDMQRTYLPGDASILGFSGLNPPYYTGAGGSNCGPRASIVVSDCGTDAGIHNFSAPVTVSDVPGHTMVMGSITVNCGPDPSLQATGGNTDIYACKNTPTKNSQTVYIEWYTPHAFQLNAAGHGTYTEVVQEQPGSGDFL